MTLRDRLLGTSSGYWSLKRVIASDQANTTIVEEYLKPAAEEAILDVGCGVGDVARYMGAASYLGVDQNPRYIERAASRNYPNATFVNASVEELPELGLTQFDKVLIIGVLHHLDDDNVASLMEHLPQVMKPNGRLVVAENAWVADQRTVARVLIALDRGRYVRSIAEYERFIKPHFNGVSTEIRHDLLRVPYTYVVTSAHSRSTSGRVDAGAPSATAL